MRGQKQLESLQTPPNPSPSSLKKHSNKVIQHTLPPSTLLPPSKQAITEFNIKSKQHRLPLSTFSLWCKPYQNSFIIPKTKSQQPKSYYYCTKTSIHKTLKSRHWNQQSYLSSYWALSNFTISIDINPTPNPINTCEFETLSKLSKAIPKL